MQNAYSSYVISNIKSRAKVQIGITSKLRPTFGRYVISVET